MGRHTIKIVTETPNMCLSVGGAFGVVLLTKSSTAVDCDTTSILCLIVLVTATVSEPVPVKKYDLP